MYIISRISIDPAKVPTADMTGCADAKLARAAAQSMSDKKIEEARK